MSFKKFLIPAAAVLFLAGCASSPSPFAMVFPGQPALTGTTIFSDGSYQASNGNLTCSANKSSGSMMVCNDGRRGSMIYSRVNGFESDHGQITFSDGSKADFFRGDEAKAY